MSNQQLLDQIFSMVDASKKKPKKARVYTEEQKQVLVDRLKKAREKKADKIKNSKLSPQEPTRTNPRTRKNTRKNTSAKASTRGKDRKN